MIGTIIGLSIIAIMIGGSLWARSQEAKEWNGGVCAACGQPWKCFNVDSQGGRGYSCSNDHVMWAKL